MANFICKCGNRLSNVQNPNDVELRVYTDSEWDSILENDTIETWKIPLPQNDVWRCPLCERVYVFQKSKLIRTYIPEQAFDPENDQ